ncbi:hypothetical protein B7P43_G12720 [Cryptotermes secundus]|uniref:FMRFamide neuropeptides n=2 Tax=Cryptotermes secundus TaxID=105785 RepID=A0A2J7PZ34_9NEOP|nr:hypothetical protein B7P43_G12720 [Cryptotermes secundus]
MAASYRTDNPITEPPSIVLAAPDDVDNMAALGSDCEPEKSIKGAEEQGQPPSDRRQCSSGEANSVDSAPERYTLGETGRGGRATDNYIRFGRGGKQDNFIRFGRDRSDNFIRFGRGRTDNFIRFGRGRQDNFIRFGRNKQGNFFRFGRDMREGNDRDETDANSKDELSTSNNVRFGRGGKSDSNFIRLGRARPNSGFIRLGRRNDELSQPGEIRRSNSNFVRFGRQTNEDKFERLSRSSGSSDLRRGKLTDRNFIRLGRSGPLYNDVTEGESNEKYEERLGRLDKRGKTQNFVRFGKRSDEDEQLVRFGRDVTHMGGSASGGNGNNTTKHIRSRRSVTFPAEDETSEDSSDYPVVLSNNAYDDKISSTLDDSQIPFRYYSPLASGLPNYILSPELSVLAPLTNGGETKRVKGDEHSRNYIRLG